MKKGFFLTLAVMILLAVMFVAGCNWRTDEPANEGEEQNNQPDNSQTESYATFTDYAGIFQRLSAADNPDNGGLFINSRIMTDEAEGISMVEKSASETPADDVNDTGSNYSTTNVQVEGIDEGDIVKTDGEYIYILRDNELIILRAAGTDTQEISRSQLGEEKEMMSSYPAELFINGDTLAVICNKYSWGEEGEGENFVYWNKSQTEVRLYDVSDAAAPRLIDSFGQDGWYQTARLNSGVLYVISNYYEYSEIVEDEPRTYVPCLYNAKEKGVAMDAADICLCPGESTAYTVIVSIDLATAKRTGQQAALGAGNNIYMDNNSLYVAQTRYSEEVDNTWTESIYKVEHYVCSSNTGILRYDVADNTVVYAAGGEVDGYIVNQFALDEYNGYLRIVTTNNSSEYTVYVDEERGFTNYKWDETSENSEVNALYVLDKDLNVVGSIEGLAEGEVIYSARFSDDIGYMVTFRQVDPLFAIDLADPTNPQVLSALKIPGFSEYLHVYGDGLLFGLGMDANEETGSTNGMKLSMFDTSDPANVTEKSTLLLDYDWSTALENHKAILIDAKKDLIGFPTNNGYVIYGYTAEKGFYLRSQAALPEDVWNYNARGLYIGNCFYVYVYNGVYVLDLDSLSEIAFVEL